MRHPIVLKKVASRNLKKKNSHAIITRRLLFNFLIFFLFGSLFFFFGYWTQVVKYKSELGLPFEIKNPCHRSITEIVVLEITYPGEYKIMQMIYPISTKCKTSN